MHRRYTLAHLILASVIALGLTPLMVSAAPQAQIAFSSERDGNFEIYVMDADGKNQRRLTTNRRDDRYPSWSPDGKRIAFTSSSKVIGVHVVGVHPPPVVDEPPQIYVMDADGKNQQKLTNTDFAEWEPSWSPDGKRIAFTSSGAMDTWGWHIYVVDADGKNLRKLDPNNKGGWYPSWSPDGKRIAFVSTRDGWGNSNIYVMDADGSNQQRLTDGPNGDRYPSWSPDGKRIAFVSSRDGRGHDIYVMDADGKNQQRLTDDLSRDTDPSWSPDGERIAFVSHKDGNLDIYVMNADGKNQRRLTRNPFPDTDPSWSPDGKRIVFVSTRDGNYEIYVMNADGARQVRRRTKDGSDDTDPAWFDPAFAVEVAPFAVSPAGKTLTIWGWLKQVDR